MTTISADLLDRIGLMQQEAITFSDARFGAYQTQSTPSYWTTRIERVVLTVPSADIQARGYYARMRYIVDNLTANYENGALERNAANALDTVLDFFAARRGLTCTAASDRLTYFDPIGTDITQANIAYGVVNTGSGSNQLVLDFTIECPFMVPVNPIYP